MSDRPLLFKSALEGGIGVSLVITAITVATGALAADMWVGKYPPDIRQRYGPMSLRAMRLRPFVAALVFTAVFVLLLAGLFALRAQIGSVGFMPALVYSAVALLVFNTFDLVVLDWLLFCTIQPRQMVLPGTAGMAG